jgi:NAD(P)-dependent dehydrogenase (short-subunit alcohol dehydrogenase family)
MGKLVGQRVCVVGGGSGIGAAVARAAEQEGATVWIAGRSVSGPRALVVDVADEASLSAFLEALPEMDHVVLSVSASAPGAIVGGDVTVVRRAFETKFWAAWRLGAELGGKLKGSLTIVSGGASRRVVKGMTTLMPLNAAVEGLVKALASELAPVRVNGISPGMVDTPYWEQRMPEESKQAMFAQVAAGLPSGRIGRPEDCAGAAVYLMTADWVTGTVLDVDGGFQIS